MASIRAKLVLFVSILVVTIGILCCVFLLNHTKRQQEDALKKFGTSLVMLLAQDNEVAYALHSAQPAFLDAAINRLRDIDMEEEIGYLRISNTRTVMREEKSQRINVNMEEIPMKKSLLKYHMTTRKSPWSRGGIHTGTSTFSSPSALFCERIKTSSGAVFCDFFATVFGKKTFSEEEFAAQILGEDKVNKEESRPVLGFVQMGLSHHKLNERTQKIIWQSIIPMGFGIVCGGICLMFFLTTYLVSPLRHMANITLDIASGNLTRMIDVQSRDEIGQLSINFNEMTRSLKASHDEKEKIMEQLRDHIKGLYNTNKELKETQERLLRSEKLATVGKLASGVGHELRNPLGAIKNALFLLNKNVSVAHVRGEGKKFNTFMEIIEKETDRSIKIVNDLLGFSRTVKPMVSPANVRALIESSLSRVRIPEKVNKIVYAEDSLPPILVDATQIEQVFINLIQNACEAMPMGGLLTIRAQKEGSAALSTTFTDTGCGIPDNVKHMIFDPLFTTKSNGLGLGLALSHSIIQRHEGHIALESQEGKGTTFTVKLPIANTQG
ncbi:MAG: HAMP domain-containing protein [Candidatus Brocadia sp.]|nr:HAMP domain-containing protein [Candidatus Brocadia sp.]